MKKVMLFLFCLLILAGFTSAQAPDFYLGAAVLNHQYNFTIASVDISASNTGLGLRLAVTPDSRIGYYVRADFAFILSSLLAGSTVNLGNYSYAFQSEYLAGVAIRLLKDEESRFFVAAGPALMWDRLESADNPSLNKNMLTLGIGADLYYVLPISRSLEFFINTGFAFNFVELDVDYDLPLSSFSNTILWSVSLGLVF
jgi:hypothetical protein